MLAYLANFIKEQRAKYTEVDITIGNVPCRATVGSTTFKLGEGYYIVYQRSVDFIVAVDTLETKPTKDDEIVWNGKRYAITSFNSEPAVRYSDPQGVSYRIHTKYIGDI